uniref:Uncharacterized protein n=1 Tax=viral metagenome TaxID=1070528 RepID=A0A6C0EAX5_9ZZZZ
MAKQTPSFLRKIWKFKYNFNPILQNKFVLYFLFLLALVQIVYFLNIFDLRSVVFFLIVGFLASFFSKNMIVILFVTLALTNIMKYGVRPSLEGMENAEGEKKEEEVEKSDENSEKEEKSEPLENKTPDMKEVNKDLKEFDNLQKEIITGMKDIGSLLDKAEGFIEKFDKYSIDKEKEKENK